MNYPIVETFFSIQGEGTQVGRPVNFIRLAGCPINCDFCDTDKDVKETVSSYELAHRMKPGFPVVITGGEPCIHDLNPLIEELRRDFLIYLETSGAFIIPTGVPLVSVSPKKDRHFTKQAADLAHEVKWLVPVWTLEEIRTLSKFFTRGPHHFIQPVNTFLGIDSNNVRLAIETATTLNWPISVQLHKLLKVR
jgi:organic radical activating enzyme